MELEYLTIGLAFATGVASVVALIYKKGIHEGMDSACEIQIKKDIKGLKTDLSSAKSDAATEHKEIRTDVSKIYT